MENTQFRKRKIGIIIMICIFLLLTSVTPVFATDYGLLTPTDDQYLELRAVEVKDVDGQNKQVVMQLWGNYLEFRRI